MISCTQQDTRQHEKEAHHEGETLARTRSASSGESTLCNGEQTVTSRTYPPFSPERDCTLT